MFGYIFGFVIYYICVLSICAKLQLQFQQKGKNKKPIKIDCNFMRFLLENFGFSLHKMSASQQLRLFHCIKKNLMTMAIKFMSMHQCLLFGYWISCKYLWNSLTIVGHYRETIIRVYAFANEIKFRTSAIFIAFALRCMNSVRTNILFRWNESKYRMFLRSKYS